MGRLSMWTCLPRPLEGRLPQVGLDHCTWQRVLGGGRRGGGLSRNQAPPLNCVGSRGLIGPGQLRTCSSGLSDTLTGQTCARCYRREQQLQPGPCGTRRAKRAPEPISAPEARSPPPTLASRTCGVCPSRVAGGSSLGHLPTGVIPGALRCPPRGLASGAVSLFINSWCPVALLVKPCGVW